MDGSPSRPPIPPPGPALSFSGWAQTVYQTILEYVPNASAAGSSKSGVTITRRPGLEDKRPPSLSELAKAQEGSITARLTPNGSTWYVTCERGGRFAMPPLAVDRHDDFTARQVAGTIIGHLDSAQSTPAKRKVAATQADGKPQTT